MNPMMILAMALQAASMYSNNQGQQRINETRKRVEKEAKRRTDENYAAAEKQRKRGTQDVEQFDQSHEQAAQVRTEKYQGAQGTSSAAQSLISPEARGNSSAVVGEEGRQKDTARSKTNAAAKARGRLDGLGDVFLTQGLNLNETGRDIRQMGDYSHGWTSRVVPYQLQRAAHMGDEQFMLGDLLSMAAGMAATKGMKPAGGTGTSGAPMTNSGTFAGGPAGIPGINGTAGMPTSGSQWDFFGGWDQYAGQFGGNLGKPF